MVEVSEERFDEMVNEALDQVPEEFVRRMRNLVILVEDENPDNPMLLGCLLYTSDAADDLLTV